MTPNELNLRNGLAALERAGFSPAIREVLADLFSAAIDAHERHNLPGGDYTTRTERLVADLAVEIAAANA